MRLGLFLVAILTPAAIHAQIRPGDLVVSAIGGGPVSVVDRFNGQPSTLVATLGQGNFAATLRMDFGNRKLLALSGWRGLPVFHITPSGGLSTFIQLTGSTLTPARLVLDEHGVNGDYVVSRRDFTNQSQLIRLTGTANASTLLYRTNWSLEGLEIDRDTGDFLVSGNSRMMRLPRGVFNPTVLANHLENTYDVAFLARTGDYAFKAISHVFIVPPRGGIASSFRTIRSNSMMVCPRTGNFVVAGRDGVGEYTPAGVAIRTFGSAQVGRLHSVEIFGSLTVSGFGSPRPGSTYFVQFSFPRAGPGAGYFGFLSLRGMRPGVPAGGGRRIDLAPDPITMLMLQTGELPGVTQGFRGVLGATASATGRIHVPPGVPPGIRVFVTAVAFDATQPSNLDTGNTWAFSTQ